MVRRSVLAVTILATMAPMATAGGGGDATPSINAFALDLYGELSTGEGNLFFSPASVAYALAMTRTGARGETAREMDRALHLEADGSSAFGLLMATLNGDGGNATLRLANRLYGQSGFPFHEAFLASIDCDFAGGFEQVDFAKDSEDARLGINGWVADRTEQRILELLTPGILTPDTRLVLVNAIYFLGQWEHPFPAADTRDRPFHLAGGGLADVPMMHNTDPYFYLAEDDLQIVALPYADDELDMVVLLPSPDVPLATLEARLNSTTLSRWLGALYQTRVAVALPRFETETAKGLKPILRNLGLSTAFDRRADFSAISDAGQLFIQDVVHKAYVRVDEEGTEAAAATGMVMGITSVAPSPPEIFLADRPFVFLIRHRSSGAFLFMGRMGDPRK